MEKDKFNRLIELLRDDYCDYEFFKSLEDNDLSNKDLIERSLFGILCSSLYFDSSDRVELDNLKMIEMKCSASLQDCFIKLVGRNQLDIYHIDDTYLTSLKRNGDNFYSEEFNYHAEEALKNYGTDINILGCTLLWEDVIVSNTLYHFDGDRELLDLIAMYLGMTDYKKEKEKVNS